MPTNFYFNNFESSQEQLLLESLIVESIKIYGHDVYYCPKTHLERDGIYLEDPSTEYNNAFYIEMYIKSVDGFEGDGKFYSKFGLEIRDQVTFTVSRKSFSEEVQTTMGTLRPNEGDIIYFPMTSKIFQIRYVESTAFFYQLGSLQTYDLVCEMFEYSGEKLNTGIPDIDALENSFSPAMTNYSLLTDNSNPYELLDEDGFKLVNESYVLETVDVTADNTEIETEADSFIDFTEIDPFSEGNV